MALNLIKQIIRKLTSSGDHTLAPLNNQRADKILGKDRSNPLHLSHLLKIVKIITETVKQTNLNKELVLTIKLRLRLSKKPRLKIRVLKIVMNQNHSYTAMI